jgi:hypothetical protein
MAFDIAQTSLFINLAYRSHPLMSQLSYAFIILPITISYSNLSQLQFPLVAGTKDPHTLIWTSPPHLHQHLPALLTFQSICTNIIESLSSPHSTSANFPLRLYSRNGSRNWFANTTHTVTTTIRTSRRRSIHQPQQSYNDLKNMFPYQTITSQLARQSKFPLPHYATWYRYKLPSSTFTPTTVVHVLQQLVITFIPSERPIPTPVVYAGNNSTTIHNQPPCDLPTLITHLASWTARHAWISASSSHYRLPSWHICHLYRLNRITGYWLRTLAT